MEKQYNLTRSFDGLKASNDVGLSEYKINASMTFR